MKNYDARIKRLEQILSPKPSITMMVDYGSRRQSSIFTLNGKSIPLPTDGDLKKFIKSKFMEIKGDIFCILNIGKDLSKGSFPEFSDLLSNNDLMITFDDIKDKNWNK